MDARRVVAGAAAALALFAGACDDEDKPVKATPQPASGSLRLLCNKVNGDSGAFSSADIPPSGLPMALRQAAAEYARYHTNKDRVLKQCRDAGWKS